MSRVPWVEDLNNIVSFQETPSWNWPPLQTTSGDARQPHFFHLWWGPAFLRLFWLLSKPAIWLLLTSNKLFCSMEDGVFLYHSFTSVFDPWLDYWAYAKASLQVNSNRNFSVWLGVSVVAHLSTFWSMWMTRAEYDENLFCWWVSQDLALSNGWGKIVWAGFFDASLQRDLL